MKLFVPVLFYLVLLTTQTVYSQTPTVSPTTNPTFLSVDGIEFFTASSTEGTKSAAQSVCSSHGGILAEAHSEEELGALLSWTASAGLWNEDVWLGLSDATSSGGGSPAHFQFDQGLRETSQYDYWRAAGA